MDIPIALASVAKGLEILKAMRDIDKNYDAATYKATIADLMSSLADAKIALVDARDEIADLKKEKIDLESQFKFKAERTIKLGQYTYEIINGGRTSYLPFCPKCISKGAFFPMVQNFNTRSAKCPNCELDLPTRGIAHAQVDVILREDGTFAVTNDAAVGPVAEA